MSDFFIRLVPVAPQYVPPTMAREQAIALLRDRLSSADFIEARLHENVVFVDAGSNWEGVNCPACGADAEGWWMEALEKASESSFADLSVHAPCCAARIDLNDMKFGWPAAFGRFFLEIANPSNSTLAPELHAQVEQAVDCKLRTVVAHL